MTYVFMAHRFCTFSYLNLLLFRILFRISLIPSLLIHAGSFQILALTKHAETLIVIVVHGCPQFISNKICVPILKSLLSFYSRKNESYYYFFGILTFKILKYMRLICSLFLNKIVTPCKIQQQSYAVILFKLIFTYLKPI